MIIDFKHYLSKIKNIFISLWLIIFLKIQKQTVSSINISIYIKKIFEQQIISIFIFLNIFFYAIENKQLCIILIMLWDDVQILYYNKIWDLIKNYYNAAERAVHDCLNRTDSKISLILNCWFHNQLFFLTITDYFINWDWNYNKVLLEFEYIQDKYNEAALTDIVLHILNKYDLWIQLFIIITDNVFNNIIMCVHLKIILQEDHDIE